LIKHPPGDLFKVFGRREFRFTHPLPASP
jgi:hypothetical protein